MASVSGENGRIRSSGVARRHDEKLFQTEWGNSAIIESFRR